MKKRKEYYEYPKRLCRWLNHCAICDQPITAGQEYYDGGYGRRCHVWCAPPPSIDDFIGSDPDFTGEQSTKEYIDEMREK